MNLKVYATLAFFNVTIHTWIISNGFKTNDVCSTPKAQNKTAKKKNPKILNCFQQSYYE